jgi:hypothetical protein
MTAVALAIVGLAVYINEPRQMGRLRIVAYFTAGLVGIVLLLAVALSIPAVYDLFVQRAQLLESYDAGHLGRFARQVIGFFLVQEHPLGIGPEAFGKMLGEDEHNMWLKGFTTYGWVGGFAYIVLVVWTLVASFPLIFQRRPWTPVVQCAFATYVGQVMIHNVIDNDHWRHLFLLYGVLWGAVAAERLYVRALHWQAARSRAAVPAALVPATAASAVVIERARLAGPVPRGLPAH